MMAEEKELETLAELISYPGGDAYTKVIESVKGLEKDFSEVDAEICDFSKSLQQKTKGELEELYTRTFDIHGLCCLDIGYVMFGEDYKRGAFLVNVTRMLREFGIDPGSELADHLPNVMKLISVMPDGRERVELIEKIMIPALDKMLEKFHPEGQNPYRYPLGITKRLLENMVAKRHIQ